MKNSFLLYCLLFLSFKSVVCQQHKDYSGYTRPSTIGKAIVEKTDTTSDTITYLGTITDSAGKIVYHVLKEFYVIQAAIVKHGHANLIFLNTKKSLVKSYDLNMPGELPASLNDNNLIFEKVDLATGKKQVQKIKMGRDLPNVFCVTPDNCY